MAGIVLSRKKHTMRVEEINVQLYDKSVNRVNDPPVFCSKAFCSKASVLDSHHVSSILLRASTKERRMHCWYSSVP